MNNSKKKLLNNIQNGYKILYDTLIDHPQRNKVAFLTIKIINKNNRNKALKLITDSYSINKTDAIFIYDYYNQVFEITQRKPLDYIKQRSKNGIIDTHYKIEKYCDKIISQALYKYFNKIEKLNVHKIEENENHTHIRCVSNKVERSITHQNCQQIKHRHKHITY